MLSESEVDKLHVPQFGKEDPITGFTLNKLVSF